MTREGAVWLLCEDFKPGDQEAFTDVVGAYCDLHAANPMILAAGCQASLDAVCRWAVGQAHPEHEVQEAVVRWIKARVARSGQP